jgi:hypothetical protein
MDLGLDVVLPGTENQLKRRGLPWMTRYFSSSTAVNKPVNKPRQRLADRLCSGVL